MADAAGHRPGGAPAPSIAVVDGGMSRRQIWRWGCGASGPLPGARSAARGWTA